MTQRRRTNTLRKQLLLEKEKQIKLSKLLAKADKILVDILKIRDKSKFEKLQQQISSMKF